MTNWAAPDVEAPQKPVLVSPESGTTGLEIDLNLTWQESENAESYSLQISDDDSFSNLVVDETNITSTSYKVTDLEDNTLYYWRVRAVKGVMASDWSKVWNFTRGEVTSVIADVGIPSEFSLFQNYPNPFNPITVIRYGMPERAHVTLTIYNSIGRLVFIQSSNDVIFFKIRHFCSLIYWFCFDA